MSSSITFMNTNWDKCYQEGAEYLKLNQILFDLIIDRTLQKLQKDHLANTLDLGCGRGGLVLKLSKVSKHVLGVDGSEIAIEYARSQNIANAKFAQVDLDNLDRFSQFYNNHFDVIFCKLTFPFIKNKSTFLKCCKKMLVHDGTLVVINPIQIKGIEYRGKEARISFAHDTLMEMLNDTYQKVECFNKSYYPKNSVIGSYIAFK